MPPSPRRARLSYRVSGWVSIKSSEPGSTGMPFESEDATVDATPLDEGLVFGGGASSVSICERPSVAASRKGSVSFDISEILHLELFRRDDDEFFRADEAVVAGVHENLALF